ncbi:hypothetical protein [Arthrobacter burdickii]|uniref:DNA-binding protein n=1 Tax=Arthrobacter burdickii TaxID=3035920 RepID=A0ABT8K3A0_9MICC|nr:hypothetical protein [Arthrobacter burdickii]MDN4611918.1 hypothetical protein [Arthrobacter burdickii]
MIQDHYTPAVLAEKLHVSASMVKAKGHSGEWPCLKLGPRTIRFTESHYQQIVELTEHKAPQQTETPRERNKRLRALLANAS